MDDPLTSPASGPRRDRWKEAAILLVAFLSINVAGALTQAPYFFHDREGWEGASYLEMARQVAAGRYPVTDNAPMVFRFGAPFLAGLAQRVTGWDLLACFRLVNGTANVLILVLLVAWLRHFLADWRIRTALCLAFLLQWDAPVRWLYFFPPHTDPWMWVFVLAGLLAVERCRAGLNPGRVALVAAVTAVGVLFREIVLIVGLVLPFTTNPFGSGAVRYRWREWPPRLVPLAAGLLAMAAVRLVAHRDNDYSFAWTALHYVYSKPWPTYLLCWFLAFGPVLWLAVFQARRCGAFLAAHQHLAVYLLIFAVLADMGGSDTERFLYWTMPVVFVLVGRAFEETRGVWPAWLLLILAGAQAIAERAVFWPAIPVNLGFVPHAWPLLTPFGRKIPFDDLYTDTAPRLMAFVSLVEYLVVGACLGAWLLWRRQQASTAPAPAT